MIGSSTFSERDTKITTDVGLPETKSDSKDEEDTARVQTTTVSLISITEYLSHRMYSYNMKAITKDHVGIKP